jgi:GNAT superfamily N-acetyltransferase
MSDLVIREAADDELDICASLIVDAYAEYAARMSPDAWSTFAHDIANVYGRMGDTRLVVAQRGDRIVGSVTMYPDWRGAQAGTLGVRLLAVTPGERGTGVGTALLEHCVEVAKAEGKQRVVLTTTQEMDAVRDLLDRLGFERATDLDHEAAPGVRLEGYAKAL